MSASLHGHPYQLQSQAQADDLHPSQATSSRAGPSTHRRSPKPSKSPSPAVLTYDAESTSPTKPKPSHLGSELYDAIVQAADPKHPDHAAWQDRYGSLSNRSSHTSVASNHKRDKLPASSPATPSSRNSFEHLDVSSRKRHTPRHAVSHWDLASRQAHDAAGSDADDPPSNEGRYTPVRASFEGSVRSLYSASVASSSHRRRNRRLRDSPKPLVPPIPPPRITSSTNWQSTYGSPSPPELASSTPHLPSSRPSPSIDTNDNHNLHGLFASSASPPLRMAHPYASTTNFHNPQKQDVKSLPSLPGMSPSDRELDDSASQSKADRLPLQNATSASANSNRFGNATSDDPNQHAKSSLRSARQPSAVTTKSSSSSLHNRTMQDPEGPYGSNHRAAASKSMSKIRQLLGPETPTLGAPSSPSMTPVSGRRDLVARVPDALPGSAPAIPPKDHARSQPRTTASIGRTPATATEKYAKEARSAKQSQDPSCNVDLNIFPLRRDDEFRANEFESSDELEAEHPSAATQLPSTSYQYTPSAATTSERGPGVVRRSLDSIISPFRAGLLSGVSSSMGRTSAASGSTSSLAIPDQGAIAEGRRSFSDSRFVRPFLPRNRNAATLGRHARPLSKVLDRPDDELEETRPSANDRYGSGKPSGAPTADSQAAQSTGAAGWDAFAGQSRPDESLPSMAGSRSLSSTFSRSTSNLHTPNSSYTGTTAQQRPRNKFGSLFTRVKGSMTPKATNDAAPHEFCPFPPSPSTSTLHQSPPGAAQTLSSSPPTPVGATSPPSVSAKKAERPFRFRVKSLTSLSSSRSKDEIVDVPPVPAIPANYVEGGAARSVWEESPKLPASSSFSSEKSARTLGRLLRRKKPNEEADVAIDTFVPLPPKMSHLDVAEEAAPRSSMSSARGFDVVEPSNSAANVALTRTTIRKTLSPALLSDSPQPGIEATFEEDESVSLVDGSRGGENGQSRLTGDGAAEESGEVVGDEQNFRSPLGRFIRGHTAADRLSRVEELSERLSYIADVTETSELRPSASMPASLSKGHSPRSFAEHRSARRNVHGIKLGQNSPSALELADVTYARARKGSLDILRPSNRRGGATALESPASMPSSALTSPGAAKFVLTPKSPAPSTWSEQLAPSWRSKNGRTSFSQDRDRAPVASPISPALPSSRGVGQAIKRLGIKGKSSKGSKDIGPTDVAAFNFDDDGDETEVITDSGSRPSMSGEPRPSFGGGGGGGGGRPSFSSTMRSPFTSGRPSFETTARNGLTAGDAASEAGGLIPSPVAPSFGSSSKEFMKTIVTDGEGRSGASAVAGLGIGSVQWSEAMPSHKGESVEIPGSASDGTFTTRGAQTPENGSLSHSMDAGSMAAKSAELLAFEDMLGRFPQQQKVLLQDISARVAKTPVVGGASASREDVSSFPPFAAS